MLTLCELKPNITDELSSLFDITLNLNTLHEMQKRNLILINKKIHIKRLRLYY